MRRPLAKPTTRRALLAGATLLGLAAGVAGAQGPGPSTQLPPGVGPAYEPVTPIPYGLPGASGPAPTVPYPAPPAPTVPSTGRPAGAPPTAAVTPGPAFDSSGIRSVPPTAAFNPSFAPEPFAARGGEGFAIADNVGYIDSAIIRSRFRLRYDSAYDNNRPDRAEFFYPKCGCFGNVANFLSPNGTFNAAYARAHGYDPRALGPQHPTRPGGNPGESRVDYQELSPYLEYAANAKTSGFIEMPVRFINPTLNNNAYGWSDMNLGFKRALVANPNQFYTFQFRTYVPTGSGERGLGTNHPSLEPAFLVFQRLTDRLYLNGEIRDWIPVHATDFAGNVLRYGVGLTYNMVLTEHLRVAPVSEFVGWSVLSGKKLDPGVGPVSAAHDTIVNAKIGLRIALGNYTQAGGGSALNDRQSLYFGYGRALTGDHWYKDILRVEYNRYF